MTSVAVQTTPPPARAAAASRWLFWAGLVLLGALLVEVMFEAWVQFILGTARVDDRGRVVADLPEWPKNLKNGLYLALAAITVAKVAVDRTWRRFTTPADIAVAVLAVVLAIAGIAGGSSLTLIGEGIYVYLRGAIVFYAWRALDPPWRRVKPLLWVLGGIIAFNALIACLQMLFGRESYKALGWADMTWARIHRAHALFDHPNHLGHVTGLALLGLLCWFITRPRVGKRWWVLFGLIALGMSATQSRESAIALLGAGVLIWFLRRDRTRTIATALAIVVVFVAAQLALLPKNRAELERRLGGVLAALRLSSGAEPEGYCVEGNEGCEENTIPQREIRVLYAQQAVKLWTGSPIVGYGVGQFGGIVAYQHDTAWNMDRRYVERLGAKGFDLHGFNAKQVDSFWMHLWIETGLLGLFAYAAWLVFLALPLLRSLPPGRRNRTRAPDTEPEHGQEPDRLSSPFVYWGIAALAFGAMVAFLSPSLEDPLLPPLLFTVVGLAWVDNRRRLLPAQNEPDTRPRAPAEPGVG